MLNYVKSEWYRVIHSKEIYLTTGFLSLLIVCVNLISFIANSAIVDYPYATVSFSFNILISSLNGLFIVGSVISVILFGDERKNGTLKNAVAYGILKESIFFGKCIISISSGFFSLAIILVFYIGSACLLLDGPVQVPIQKLLGGIGAALPTTIASVILAVALIGLLNKEITAVVWWVMIMFLIPQVFFYIGLKVDFMGKIAEWMPGNFFKFEVIANMSGYQCLWDTPFGLMKCIVAGVAGIIIFAVFGILVGKKKEI